MTNVLGNWIDPSTITAVSAIEECPQESEFFFMVSFKHGGAIDIESECFSDVDIAHDTVMQAWDRELQRAELEDQFKRGLEKEDDSPHGVEIKVYLPADTPKADIQKAINTATEAIFLSIDDAGGGL
jgi:hypothetical protein